MVEYLARGYSANRDRFPFGRAKMVWIDAYAASMEEGLEGKWLSEPEPVRATCNWVKKGSIVRYDWMYDPGVIERGERKQGDTLIRRFVNRSWVRGTRFEFSALPDTNQYWVAPLGRLTFVGWSPFNLRMGPEIDERVRRYDTECVGERDFDGRRLPVLKFTLQWRGKTQVDYVWIDTERGFLPVRDEAYFPPEERVSIVTEVPEVAECSGGRWLPTRWVQVTRSRLPGRPPDVTEVKVIELEVDEPPADELLQIELPPRTVVMNLVTGQHFRVLGGRFDLRWVAGDGSIIAPAGMVQPFEAAARATAPVNAPWLQQRQRASRLPWILVAIGVSAGLLALVLCILRPGAAKARDSSRPQ